MSECKIIRAFDAKTTQFCWETENSERQMKDKHGHVVVISVACFWP